MESTYLCSERRECTSSSYIHSGKEVGADETGVEGEEPPGREEELSLNALTGVRASGGVVAAAGTSVEGDAPADAHLQCAQNRHH